MPAASELLQQSLGDPVALMRISLSVVIISFFVLFDDQIQAPSSLSPGIESTLKGTVAGLLVSLLYLWPIPVIIAGASLAVLGGLTTIVTIWFIDLLMNVEYGEYSE